jgi:hypothetical protein
MLGMKDSLIILSFLLFQPLGASASTDSTVPGPCDFSSIATDNLQIDIMNGPKGCTLRAHATDTAVVNRSFTFTQRGVIQIFNDYSSKPNDNASRTYFVFPRAGIPSSRVITLGTGKDEHHQVEISTSAGDKILFATGERVQASSPAIPPSIVESPDANFQMIEDPMINPTNQGGVEIKLAASSQTVILDTGFRFGEAGFMNQNGSSSFIDGQRHSCKVANKDLFTYAHYDADLKWKDDASFFQYLKTACPTLSLPELAPAAIDDQAERRPAHAHDHGH